MAKIKRISSKSGKRFIDVLESDGGYYELQKYVKKFDQEEEMYYEVREHPGPTGIYGDLESAVNEAIRLIEQDKAATS